MAIMIKPQSKEEVKKIFLSIQRVLDSHKVKDSKDITSHICDVILEGFLPEDRTGLKLLDKEAITADVCDDLMAGDSNYGR